ncbi:hypothetical protein, partial [Streptomyces sp. NPDC046685]|uniref:hypothetical protein n=1 Tax=Streptomyces sp. NPDC046685 TaxID=3157202 RepID=UPI0033FA05E6
MRSTRPTTTQTTCDCENCPLFTITGHIRRTTPANQAAQHHQAAAVDGWMLLRMSSSGCCWVFCGCRVGVLPGEGVEDVA